MLLKGKSLKPNSTLGIISPASPESEPFIKEKISEFISLGYKVKLGNHIFDRYGYLAGSDRDRAKDIMDMFLDDYVDGIICFRGGYGSIRTLPYLDLNLIKRHPKFFCGFSDITILLNYFAKNGLITFHGPMINSNFKDNITLESFVNVCSSTNDNYTYDFSHIDNLKIFNPSSFSGNIVGGNLSMICSSIGTPYEVSTKNSILLLEEINESPYAIDRMLTQLILNKKFKTCKGIIIGHMTGCTPINQNNTLTIDQIIADRLEPLNIPILYGAPFGHDYPNLTIPIGCKAYFNINSMNLVILNKFLN